MLVESFLEYLQFERGYSVCTVTAYKTDLAKFREYYLSVERELDWDTIDADIVRCWMIYLMDQGYTATSVNRKLSSLRSY